jgi:translation initiation factor 2B subunit (eIF-2B alpha/beta/delta family)/8-oxo-dGTP pyrophosphatase MutT (NUDIX family)
MEETRVVTGLLRSGVEVLLLRRSDAVGDARRWGGVAGHAEGDPDAAIRGEVREETGIDPTDIALLRRGEPFDVADEELGVRWTVHPYLFGADGRPAVGTDWESDAHEWVQPTAILDRETVPGLWRSYRAVGPTVGTVRADREHGSAYLSLRAVEVLRDRAAAVAAGRQDGDLTTVAALARDLLAARPSMTALATRVNRAMADAGGPAAVAASAERVLAAAVAAETDAAAAAAERIEGETVATLSRSGTVLGALRRGDPAAVLLAESRPGREGVAVAEELAAGTSVTLAADAALPGLLERADRLLVGADTVLPDGEVLNKVGTYPLALAADRAGVPVDVAAARDKVAPDPEVTAERGDPADVYDGDAPLTVEAPLFEVTPADLVGSVVTESGVLDAEAVASVAADHRALADWNR